jgi:hypothetical protein
MTIAAGFVATDGVVLGADSLYSGQNKRYRAKIWKIPDDNARIVIAGAGDASLIQRAADEFESLVTPSMDRAQLHRLADDIAYKLHVKHVKPDPDNRFTLLIAIADGAKRRLYRAQEGVVASVVESDCIGWGDALGLYFADMFFKKSMTTASAAIIASHLLLQTKTYSAHCGGKSHILIFPTGGDAYFLKRTQIADIEQYFDDVTAAIQKILIRGYDRSVSASDLQGDLDGLIEALGMPRTRAIQAQTSSGIVEMAARTKGKRHD